MGTVCVPPTGALEGGTWRPRQDFGVLVSLSVWVCVSGPVFLETETCTVALWRIDLFPGDWSRGLFAACSFGIERPRIREGKNPGPRNRLSVVRRTFGVCKAQVDF